MTNGEACREPRPLGRSPLAAAGERLWRSVTDHYDLDEHEATLLHSACTTADLIDVLDATVAREGAVIESPQGRKAHPALVEVRQQKIALARLLAALRLPQGEEGDTQASARPQRRGGVRGVQVIRA